ncbi:MAG: CAP domain-containing protein [Terriglobales bacterium]
MIRGLVVAFALWVVSLGMCKAETNPTGTGASNGVHRDVHSEQPTPQSNSAASASSDEDSAAEFELLKTANKNRELAGLPPLQMEASLSKAALAHGMRMVANKRLEHQFPGEPALLERIALVIVPESALKIDRAGENIANAACTQGANEVLMQSTPHRKNLLDRDFNIAGIAAIWSDGRLYVVQDFAHELPSYTAQQSQTLVIRAVTETRQQAGLHELVQLMPPKLNDAACTLAQEDRPNARLLAAAYDNRKVIAYTQSRPEVLPQGALRILQDPRIHQFAVGSCYARNAAYPTGMYWVAILLY